MKNFFTKAFVLGVMVLFGIAVLPAQAQYTANKISAGVYATAIAKDNKGHIFVIEDPSHGTTGTILEYSKAGVLINSSVYSNSILQDNEGNDDYAYGIVVASNGDIYFTTSVGGGSGNIIRLQNNGNGTYTEHSWISGNGTIMDFESLAIDASDNLYVVQYDVNGNGGQQTNGIPGAFEVCEYPAGTTAFVSTNVWYSKLELTQFASPDTFGPITGLTVDVNGAVYVADSFDVSHAANYGGFVEKITKSGSTYTASQFTSGKYCTALGADSLGNVYAAEGNDINSTYNLVQYKGGSNTVANTNTIYTGLANDGTWYPFSIAAPSDADIFINNGDDGTLGDFLQLKGPTINSITANNAYTNATSETFTVTFSEAITGVTASNFSLTTSGVSGASIGTPTTSNNITWSVPVNTGSGDGTLGLNLANSTGMEYGISTALPFTGGTTIVDKTAPTIMIGSPSQSSIIDGAGSVTYTVTYADANFASSSLILSNITLNKGSTANGTVGLTGSGTSYTVTISSITGSGTLGISIAAGTALDKANNSAPASAASTTFNVLTPTITAPGGTTTLTATASGTAGAGVSFNISGSNLLGNITATAPANVQVSSDNSSWGSTATITESGGTLASTPVFVRLAGTGTVGTISGNVALSSSNANTVNQAVSGTLNAPSTTISSLTAVNSTLTNLASVQYTATFATAISGLTASNFTFTGGAGSVSSPSVTGVSPSSGSSTTFTITVNTGSGDGSLQLVFANATGLSPSVSNTGFAGTTYTIDKTAPTVSIGPPSSAYAKSGTTVSYSISWSDANLNVSSIAAGGLSSNVSHTGVTFTSINFLPGTGGNPTTVQFAGLSGNGTLSFFVPAGSATDNAGNSAAASSQSASVIVDSNAPTISIGPPSASLTTGGPVTYTVTYNDANFNSSTLSSSDITLNNGGSSASASSIVVGGGSGTTRTVTLSGITGDGTLGITIGAGTATDLAGNSAPASSASTTFTVDNTPPTVSSITATTPSNSSPTNATSVSYTVTFSEPVTNVSNAAFTAITSSVSTTGITVSPVSSSVYTVTVNGISGTGTLGLNFNSSGTGITDLAGNAISGGGFTGDVYNIDNTPPTVSSVTATTPSNVNPTNATSVSYTVTFSEPVTGVAAQSFTATTSGVSATGILVTPVTSSVYTVTVTGISGDGTLRLDVKSANNNIFDAAFNPMTTGFTGDVYNIDNTPPTALSLAAQDPTPTNETQLDYTITFSEAVTGVAPGDFTAVTSSGITVGTISVTPTSASTYNLSVVNVSGNGTVQVNLNSSGTGITDLAGNPISGGINGDVFTVDQTPPTVTAITATTPSNTNPTNSTTLAYTVTFSEAVTGVDNTDFTGNNLTGSVSYSSITVTPVSSSVYTVTLNGISGDGTMRLDLNGSGTGITDLVGNAISGGFTGDVYTIDNTPPTALSLIYKSNNANSQLLAKVGDVITLDFTASEAIQAPSLTIAGQSITAVNTTGNEWVGTYTMSSGDTEGRIPFSLSFSDLAGNPQPGIPYNDVNAGDDIEFDKTPPTVMISAPSVTSIGNNGIGTVTYTVTYADANFSGSNLTNGGITLNTSGTANGSAVVSGSGASYTVTISSITGIGTLGISVGAGAASDLAGNTDAGQGPSATFNVLASDATLSGLTLSHGTLSPAFASGTTGYTANEFNGTQTITVTPSTTDPNATILINGSIPVTSGAASTPITLTVGSNTINVAVTAQDGVTTKTYTVTVTRAPSSNDNLAGLTMDHGILSPSFTKGNTSYTASVGNTVSMIAVKAALSDATALLKIDGSVVSSGVFSSGIPLSVGPNTITVTVKAQDNISTKTYTVIVTRAPSTNDKLALLQVSKGIFGPAFTSTNTSYTDAVGNTISSVTVTPTTADPTATVQVNGITVTSGTPSGPVNVPFGASTINVKVTAQDGSTNQTYAIAVSRPANSDADLSALHMSMGRFGWPFDRNITTYADTVSNDKTMIKVIPTTRDTGARVTVNGIAVVSGTESGPVSLVFGNNPIPVVVTAEDGTTKTYTVNVLRPVYDRDNLVELKVSKGIFSPVFDSGTTSYTDNVGNSISSITVTPTVGNATATIKVNGLPVASGAASGPINLAVGSTTIHVVVKAQDSIATKTYTITVNRASGSVDSYQDISVTKPTETPQLAEDGVQVHQGISPNGDGINDYLQIDNISQYPNNKLSIMNRNGQLIYEASGYDNSSKVFDGHSNKNGQMQLPGTYFYQLDYTVSGITKHKTGFIILKY